MQYYDDFALSGIKSIINTTCGYHLHYNNPIPVAKILESVDILGIKLHDEVMRVLKSLKSTNYVCLAGALGICDPASCINCIATCTLANQDFRNVWEQQYKPIKECVEKKYEYEHKSSNNSDFVCQQNKKQDTDNNSGTPQINIIFGRDWADEYDSSSSSDEKHSSKCRFGDKCWKQDCTFRHPFSRKIGEHSVNRPTMAPCKFGSACNKASCTFGHPNRTIASPVPALCKFGSACNNAKCTFGHPNPTVTKPKKQKQPSYAKKPKREFISTPMPHIDNSMHNNDKVLSKYGNERSISRHNGDAKPKYNRVDKQIPNHIERPNPKYNTKPQNMDKKKYESGNRANENPLSGTPKTLPFKQKNVNKKKRDFVSDQMPIASIPKNGEKPSSQSHQHPKPHPKNGNQRSESVNANAKH